MKWPARVRRSVCLVWVTVGGPGWAPDQAVRPQALAVGSPGQWEVAPSWMALVPQPLDHGWLTAAPGPAGHSAPAASLICSSKLRLGRRPPTRAARTACRRSPWRLVHEGRAWVGDTRALVERPLSPSSLLPPPAPSAGLGGNLHPGARAGGASSPAPVVFTVGSPPSGSTPPQGPRARMFSGERQRGPSRVAAGKWHMWPVSNREIVLPSRTGGGNTSWIWGQWRGPHSLAHSLQWAPQAPSALPALPLPATWLPGPAARPSLRFLATAAPLPTLLLLTWRGL